MSTSSMFSSVQQILFAPPVPAKYRLISPLLTTQWTDKIGKIPWPQHPRPLLYRKRWQSLNGLWTYQEAVGGDDAVNHPPVVAALAQEVLIPSCIESGISGVMTQNVTHMWFARRFDVPADWPASQRIILNFEAVDYEATVFVNGNKVGFHRGGYFRFSVDVTDSVRPGGLMTCETVFVFDPTDQEPYYTPHGKQTKYQSHIFYTPCSGIWQSVWLESAPADYISDMDIAADMDGIVRATVYMSSNAQKIPVNIVVHGEGGAVLASSQGLANETFTFKVPSPKLWSPDSPNLYNLTVAMGDDTVQSYTGFRTVTSGVVNGIQRPLLNGKFIFQFGTLDQGYWPDGIYVPPTLEAMVYDLHLLKNLGMNMVRKHIKVEPDLFYQACDQLGLLVIQDMPSMRPANYISGPPNATHQAEFERQIEVLVTQFRSYPSIVTWVIYNEGWGQLQPDGASGNQFPEFHIADRVRQLDGSNRRLIDAVTGWVDHGAGDFSDNHHYADPQCGTPWSSLPSIPYDSKRIGFQGEFGGVGHRPADQNLWPVQNAVNSIPETYEINTNLDAFNYRAHTLLGQLREQVALYACSGAVWTQTTDVEGEVNGLVTYDRRILRVNTTQWKADIKALYDAAEKRT
ncbi:glycoside hydrolase family 2 protein [Bombardia bombarda]|uniref:Glycoside hydrolase family 2 protein n=1 Tax=Bombardia bombarda TaxID=252184 RepID=A0AA39X765_9PEZI|nr:glycoside hydrolase family 2 protein [Bombardia bombarda]